MKRHINATTQYNEFFTIQHGRKKFAVHFSDDGPYDGSFRAQITEIHPYDDAEYAWARVKHNGLVEFIQNGEIIDRMQLSSYEEDDYEDINDYYNDMLDTVAVELIGINRNVEPTMIHN